MIWRILIGIILSLFKEKLIELVVKALKTAWAKAKAKFRVQ